jgi:hypothetical protein
MLNVPNKPSMLSVVRLSVIAPIYLSIHSSVCSSVCLSINQSIPIPPSMIPTGKFYNKAMLHPIQAVTKLLLVQKKKNLFTF